MAELESRHQKGFAVMAGALAASCLRGCAGLPPVATTNHPMAEECSAVVPGRADQVLSSGQESQVLGAMRSVAAGAKTVPLAPAPLGVRWSDVPDAVSAACGEQGVEMVIVQTIKEPDRYQFILRTVEDLPGELVIKRVCDDRVYEIESAWVGRFPQEPARLGRRDALVKSFEKHLKALGRMRAFE